MNKHSIVTVKAGTNVLTRAVKPGQPNHLNHNVINDLAHDLSDVITETRKVLVVTSGAVAAGNAVKNLKAKYQHEDPIKVKQALAAAGQLPLNSAWASGFATASVARQIAGPILLTHNNLSNPTEKSNLISTLDILLAEDFVPLINENDTVAIGELKFGDNDQLASLVARTVQSEVLILLTDVDGVYDKHPKYPDAKRFTELSIGQITEDFIQQTGDGNNENGTGGMASKLKAAKLAAEHGITTYIASGKQPGIVSRILAGSAEGTRVFA